MSWTSPPGLLTNVGYEVETAPDGVEAAVLYKEAFETSHPFAAVILDLTVPGGMGGKETALELLKIDSRARIIVSSGYSNDQVMADFKKYGFRGAVAKPYKIEDLCHIVHAVVTAE